MSISTILMQNKGILRVPIEFPYDGRITLCHLQGFNGGQILMAGLFYVIYTLLQGSISVGRILERPLSSVELIQFVRDELV